MNKSFVLVVSLALLCGCAGKTLKEKTWRNMIAAGAVGAVIGSQQPAFKSTQAALFAATAASLAAAVSLHVYEAADVDLKSENERLRQELDQAFDPKREAEAPGTMNAKVPAKYQNLIDPGQWRVFQIDEWVEDGENRMIHQDKVMELIPPSLRPLAKPTKPKGSTQ